MGRRWTKTAACLALLVGLAACGGGLEPRAVETGAAVDATVSSTTEAPEDSPADDAPSDGGPAADAGTPIEVLATTVERTSSIESARFEMVVMYDISESPEFLFNTMRTTGEVADAGRSVHMVLTSEPDLTGSIEQTFIDGIAYVDVPEVGCQTVDLSDLLGGSSVIGGGASDPSSFLQYLRGVSGEVEDLGPLEVRGVDTTHFATEFTTREVMAAAPDEQADAMEELYADMPDSFLDAEQTLDVFVDADGLVRRMQIATPAVTASGATVPSSTTILDYFDFGADVTIDTPTDCSPAPSSGMTLPLD